jgi:hypothetical protein
MWRYLIGVSPAEIRRIPDVDHVEALPSWVPAGGRALVGFWMGIADYVPRKKLSANAKKHLAKGWMTYGWGGAIKERIASQVESIRHWQVLEGDALNLEPSFDATWFVDPPYNNRAGSHYVHSRVDYAALGAWCQRAAGQVIVCENEGATWLPFRPFGRFKNNINGAGSREVIWTNEACV